MISEHLAGGDCLNVGCVPSKALLHCARVVREARAAHEEGLFEGDAPAPSLDFGAVMARMRRLRAQIAPADSHEATVGAGADVYQGRGRFVGPNAIEVNGKTLRFKVAVVATGGRAAVPPIPGLATAPYLTNATIFNLTSLPRRLVVLGAGAVGLEMAQAFRAFGSEVTVIVRSARVLSKESVETSDALRDVLSSDGVRFLFESTVQSVKTLRDASDSAATANANASTAASKLDAGSSLIELVVQQAGGTSTLTLKCNALLVATGRVPNVTDLGLGEAGVSYKEAEGIEIDDFGRTTNPSVYAIGDCAAGVPRFTHVAGEMAKLVVQNALFGDSWRVSSVRTCAPSRVAIHNLLLCITCFICLPWCCPCRCPDLMHSW